MSQGTRAAPLHDAQQGPWGDPHFPAQDFAEGRMGNHSRSAAPWILDSLNMDISSSHPSGPSVSIYLRLDSCPPV